jgi:hypothetical protein
VSRVGFNTEVISTEFEAVDFGTIAVDADVDKIIFGVKTMSAGLDGVEFKTERAIIGTCFGQFTGDFGLKGVFVGIGSGEIADFCIGKKVGPIPDSRGGKQQASCRRQQQKG